MIIWRRLLMTPNRLMELALRKYPTPTHNHLMAVGGFFCAVAHGAHHIVDEYGTN
jgi:hypothetical protein